MSRVGRHACSAIGSGSAPVGNLSAAGQLLGCFRVTVLVSATALISTASVSTFFTPMPRATSSGIVFADEPTGREASATQAAAVPIGEKIPDVRFKDIRGLVRSLDDFGSRNAYVLVFTTTHCPLVRQYLPKLNELDKEFSARDVQFIAVNVGLDDTIRDMAAQAIDHESEFAFVKDVDHSCVTALGVKRTPEAVVLDAKRRLVYRGRIDDQLRLGGARPTPTRRDLFEALQDVLAERPVAMPETPVDGCLISGLPPLDATLPLPTYHQDIAPILADRCVRCHQDGTAAPFPLTDYDDAKAHAEMIADVVVDLRMPPWFANPRHGVFQNDPSLTRQERDLLVRWVRTGRTRGTVEVPPPSDREAGDRDAGNRGTEARGKGDRGAGERSVEHVASPSPWHIGEPDLVITMLARHSVPATGFVPYQYVVLPHVFVGETWVEAVEILPDNPAVVHHCNMAYVTKDGAGEETFITGYVPGGQPLDLGRFKGGVAARIPAFAALGLEVHYTTVGTEETCRIAVGLRFPKDVVRKRFQHVMLDARRLAIQPGHGAYPVRPSRTLDQDAMVLGLFAHMHLRGKDVTFFAEAPDARRETLLQIPNYNFEWQLGYEIEPGRKRLPKGTKLEALVHYDNSAFNPFNPDPKRTVPWGRQTYDEMFNGFVFFVAEKEDLNLTVDPKTGRVRAAKPGT